MGYIMGLVLNIPFSDVFLPSLLQCFALYDTKSSKKGVQIAGMPSTGQTEQEKNTMGFTASHSGCSDPPGRGLKCTLV